MYEARELAMTRMEEEADLLGADGVVGVRLVFKQYAMDEGVLEFQAIGTAIRHRDREGQLSHEGQSSVHVRPERAGSLEARSGRLSARQPAMGACVYHIAHLSFMQALKQVGRNQEMKVYTEATYAARELALERMQAEAVERGGIGVVGARVEESNWGWGANAIEFFAVGTAVAPMSEAQRASGSDAVQQVVTFDSAG